MDFLVPMFFCGWVAPLLVVGPIIALSVGLHNALELRGVSAKDPHCGHCKYIVRGVGSWRCPECGYDLRRVRVLTRDEPRPFPLGARVLLLLIAFPAPAVFAATMLIAVVPHNWQSTQYVTFEVVKSEDGDSRYRAVQLHMTATGWQSRGPFHADQVTLTFHEDDATWDWVDMDGERILGRQWSGNETKQPWSLEAFAALVPLTPNESEDIWLLVNAALKGESLEDVRLESFDPHARYRFRNSYLDPPGWLILLLAVAGCVGLGLVMRASIRAHDVAQKKAIAHREAVMAGIEAGIEKHQGTAQPAGDSSNEPRA